MSRVRCGNCGWPLSQCECPRELSWLQQQYELSEKAGKYGVCPGCEDKDAHVLCTVCAVCFRYCHPEKEHAEGFKP